MAARLIRFLGQRVAAEGFPEGKMKKRLMVVGLVSLVAVFVPALAGAAERLVVGEYFTSVG